MKQKGMLARLFCKHKNTDWYEKDTKYQLIRGTRKYKLCNDCGRMTDTLFYELIDKNYI